jgi:hypothetical protein
MKNKYRFVFLILLLSISIIQLVANEEDDQCYFKLDALVPKTRVSRITLAEIIAEELLKIGVEVENHILGWGEIGPRSWSYPLSSQNPYVPEYAEGGFDILYVGYYWDIDPILTGFFESDAIVPSGDNFYQYDNPEYDDIFDEYITTQNPTLRTSYIHQLQSILYEDLPATGLFYNHSLMAMREEVSGIDPILIGRNLHRAENWENSDDHIVKFGLPGFFNDYNIFTSETYWSTVWMQPIYGGLFQKNP